MSEEEIMTPQIRAIFDLIVMQHPDYSNFVIMDNGWGWAQKVVSESKQVRYQTNATLWYTLRRMLKSIVGSKKQNLHVKADKS